METVLEAVSLSKRFGGISVADGIDFSLVAGRVRGLVGPNGAGKSSLINLMCGSVTPDAGDIRLQGRTISRLSASGRAQAGISRTWQHIRLFPSLSVLDNLVVAARHYSGDSILSVFGSHHRQDAEVTAFAHRQLQRVGMERFADSLPGELSIGKQKLASLARALMNRGSCLFLDEPVAGVEGAAYDVLKQLIREQAAAGQAICIVEHNISFIEDLCDDCAFMFNGAIMAEGSISDLIRNPVLTELYFGSHK